MKYGHFSEDGKEFIITDPDTPRPWINYLTNEKYCAVISQTAGGYSFYKDCRVHRMTRWAPENLHFDRPGKYIYVKDLTAGKNKPKVWSATYRPVREKYDYFECRHGLGYTVITSEYNGVRCEITYFVPREDTCEVWLVKITNKSKGVKNLEVYPYVEWLIGEYHEELRYRNIMNLYTRAWFDKAKNAIFAKKTAIWKNMAIQEFPFLLFMASSLPVIGFATRKDRFLGKYNTEEKPAMLFGEFKNTPFSSGEDSVGVTRHRITLAPAGTKTFAVTLGQALNGREAARLLSKYKNVKKCAEELKRVKSLWHERICENISVDTPDSNFNVMANIWMKYQLYICNLWSRSPSFYHEGSGGRGYRDSCQDAESIASINHELTHERILKLASLIRREGTSAPGWSEISGPAEHRPNKDHQIWLTMTVAAYIKETGNKNILFNRVPYLKDKWLDGWYIDPKHRGGSREDGQGPLYEHLERNLNYCFYDVGERGLPKIGHADWNDAIDAAGIKLKGESMWLAVALVRSLKTFAEMMDVIGKSAKAAEFRRKAETMSKRVNRYWDGDWYVRGFTDDGTVYGSKRDSEGKIYINPQAWALMAGVADKEKTRKIIKSVERYLNGEHGIALFYPAYTKYNRKLGRISMFSEGTKENAAVFCHAAMFHIVALLMYGESEKAYNALKKIMPNCQKDYELYKTEPYVFAEYLIGPQHPYRYGEGAFTWVTGTAGWAFMAVTEHMLGARRDYEGLRIDPCIPPSWKRCSVKRPFRGTIFNIEILNPEGVEKGIKKIYLDGKEIDGNLIVPAGRKKESDVRVIMGKRR